MYILGLTGSMASGKSTATTVLRRMGVPVFCADDAAHKILSFDADAIKRVAEQWPETLQGGAINRKILFQNILGNSHDLYVLESILFPRIALKIKKFLRRHQYHPVVVLDIPLLYETGFHNDCDGILVITCPEKVRGQRLQKRGLCEAEIHFLESHQVPLARKKKMADFVVSSAQSRGKMREDLRQILASLPSVSYKRQQTFKIERQYYA